MSDKNIMKQIAEQKLRAFSIGTMGKRQLSKKEIEEQRKREQEEAAAQAFEEFVATFQESPAKSGKVWVKAGTYDAGRRQEDTKEKGKLYKPQSRLSDTDRYERSQNYQSSDKKSDRSSKSKKDKEKKKSNLELFKEELKIIQKEREERHKYKSTLKSSNSDDTQIVKATTAVEEKIGSFDCGDPTTTNLYLGNLNPKLTEQQLMEVFGKYGPLASIKIMWPRSDEEKARGRNCGFVAFMNRKDGERALKNLNGKDVMSYEMKLGWGKAILIPPHPIYIPPTLLELTVPPPHTGLPFNAQPALRDKNKVPRIIQGDSLENPEDVERMNKILSQAVVKVVVPTDRNLVMLIHHMIEFVVREGPMFEAMIMNREINNPLFRFLFENQSPSHIYYRWKLFSMLQGDSQNKWRTQEFRMFKGGSIWKPPPMNLYTQGMPEDLVEPEVENRKGTLSPAQHDRLEDLVRNITPERLKVAEVMVFCIEHSDAAEEICDVILESLSSLGTTVHKKIARLYLISDILHNCGVKISNASHYRRALESRLLDIFHHVHLAYQGFESRMKAEGFRVRVMQIFRAWEDWAVYPKDFLIRLQNAFLGLTSLSTPEMPVVSDHDEDSNNPIKEPEVEPENDEETEADIEDLDGVPLDGAALLKGAMKHNVEDDIDGIPMDDDIDGKPLENDCDNNEGNENRSGGFVLSRWETVDPDLVESQAMTTSKWEMLEQQQQLHQQEIQYQQNTSSQDVDSQEESNNSMDYRDSNDSRRAKLREIEVKVMQYQDELESGRKSLKTGMTMQHQVQHYRRKLLRKAERSERSQEKKEKLIRRSSSSEDFRDGGSKRSKRSRSSSESPPPKRVLRSRSKSPVSNRKSRRSSRSPYSSRKRSPSSSRSKRLSSPLSRNSKRGSPSPPSSRSRYRSRSSSRSPPSSRSKHSRLQSPSPPRKHKHKHKY